MCSLVQGRVSISMGEVEQLVDMTGCPDIYNTPLLSSRSDHPSLTTTHTSEGFHPGNSRVSHLHVALAGLLHDWQGE